MKNFIFIFFLAIFIAGCSSRNLVDNSIIKTSSPIFIDEIPTDKRIFLNFSNTSGVDSNLTQALNFYFQKDGYKLSDEKNANIIIKGNLNYFRRTIKKDEDPFLGGFGFFSGRNGFGVGFGPMDFDYYDARLNSYIYDGQISLLLRLKNLKTTKDYATNLDFVSDRNINSLSTMMEIFNYKIYKQILYFLGDIRVSNTEYSRK